MRSISPRIVPVLAALALLGCPAADAPDEGAVSEDAAAADSAPAQETTALAPSGMPYSEQREACADRDPLKRAHFGELHVHSVLSMDANIWDVRSTPDDAYRFAKGEAIGFAPLDESGQPTRQISNERPLHFAAVTDHASFLGEVSLCRRPDSPVYDSDNCRVFRGELAVESEEMQEMGSFVRLAGITGGVGADPADQLQLNGRIPALCGEDGAPCVAEMDSVWSEIKAAAERHYDRSSDCSFTTFHAYEYTATPDISKVHRNVVFRNAVTLDSPIAFVDEPDVWNYFERLDADCLQAGNGCDVLSIPHNSNLSNGRMFTIDYADEALDDQRGKAALRAEIEPLVEIMQIKGDSECRNGLWKVAGGPDEQCDFEKLWPGPQPPEDCQDGTGQGALVGLGCQSRLDFARYALVEGLREEERIGVNPYRFGIVAATDAHNANPGDAEEISYDGWAGYEDDLATDRLNPEARPLQGAGGSNPGGLAGVWAEENSRDALFDAMRRREAFGTSGPRIEPRFFGGWGYSPDLCGDLDMLSRAYAGGVPMGGDLPAPPDGAAAPVFAVSALRDPGTENLQTNPLQRIQIVKGWSGEDDVIHQAVYDVAGSAADAPGADPETCAARPGGHDSLCAVWTDPDFDPDQRAVYYARVLEVPSCRWSALQCNALPEDERPSICSNPAVPRTVSERAWTSPIWFAPAGGEG
ncbi:MAG: DUF3604 domain-containing protein [Proteobacteria bacterium]|nr:DUF3604 domain-containing protein [Pseudomonadota bacterium]